MILLDLRQRFFLKNYIFLLTIFIRLKLRHDFSLRIISCCVIKGIYFMRELYCSWIIFMVSGYNEIDCLGMIMIGRVIVRRIYCCWGFDIYNSNLAVWLGSLFILVIYLNLLRNCSWMLYRCFFLLSIYIIFHFKININKSYIFLAKLKL